MRIVRLLSHADGTSHFEDLEVALAPSAYAPPAPPIEVSDRIPASRAVLFPMPAGWFGDGDEPSTGIFVHLAEGTATGRRASYA